jgi:hypothetical protein
MILLDILLVVFISLPLSVIIYIAFFNDLPEWHDKRGDDYLDWKEGRETKKIEPE